MALDLALPARDVADDPLEGVERGHRADRADRCVQGREARGADVLDFERQQRRVPVGLSPARETEAVDDDAARIERGRGTCGKQSRRREGSRPRGDGHGEELSSKDHAFSGIASEARAPQNRSARKYKGRRCRRRGC
jgi:hypothetical protein